MQFDSGVGARIGGGVYATDRRLFIPGHGKATFPASLNKVAPGSDKGDFASSTLSSDQNEAIVRALSENRFEIGKDKVSRIEVKKSPGSLRTGWLKLSSGDRSIFEMKVSGNNEYEWTVRIVQVFKPEAVTLGQSMRACHEASREKVAETLGGFILKSLTRLTTVRSSCT